MDPVDGSHSSRSTSSTSPLASLTDLELWNSQVLLAIACGRNKSSFRRSRRQYFCLLQQNLKAEADQRGLKSPTPPYGVADFKSGAL